MQLFRMTFSKTFEALNKLKIAISCGKCSKFSSELFSLGQCEHHFCLECWQANGGKPCPVCDIPAYATLAHMDKQLSSLALLCNKMTLVLNGRTDNDLSKQPNNTSHGESSAIYNRRKVIVPIKSDEMLLNGDSNSAKLTTPVRRKVTPIVKKTLSETKKSNLVENLNNGNNTATTPNRSKNTAHRRSNLMKRNAKGETQLQVATIKADVQTVKTLLEENANPNVKDYAGWTPLHEAVNHGSLAIAELLIKHGASVNCPGLNNDTPLHDAVSNYHKDCVRLLVASGANIMARNLQGLTPLDLAKSNELKEILLTTRPVSDQQLAPSTSKISDLQDSEHLCFIGTTLSKENQKTLEKVANLFSIKFVETFTAEVTHLITEVNVEGKCPRTLKYLTAILSGAWVIKSNWLTACLEKKQLVPEDEFEVTGCSTHPDSQGAQKGRLNKIQQLPGLFHGCQFYFHGKFSYPAREELIGLVKLGSGVILTREPRLHNLDDYLYTIPYHATEESALVDCSIFVIYDDSCPNPPHVQAQRMSYLPVSWLLDSIATFTLINRTKFKKA